MKWKPAVTRDLGAQVSLLRPGLIKDCIVVVGAWIANLLLLLHAVRYQLTLDLVVHPLRQHALGHQLIF